jgi:methyltransferase (TIGR00027 family)
MEVNQAGITALVTAYARAYHATHDSPKIFDDFLADALYTKEEHIRFDQNLAQMLPGIAPELAASTPDQTTALAWVIQLMHGPVTLSRSRYAEDSLEEAIRQGVRQYVDLGAGFDTFAFRRPDLVARLRVFEVDHPTTQVMKRQRIATTGWELPSQLHFVPIDFTKDSLATTLQSASYDPQQLSFFSWQGVTYYLTQELVFATLKTIASIAPQGSTIVFDYMDTDAFIPERAAKRTQLMHGMARRVGEPMKAGLDPLTLAGDLDRLGLQLRENLSPADIEARYFQNRSDRYHAFEHVHFASAVVS